MQFPLPMDVQTLAMTMEMGASLIENGIGAEKIKSGIIRIRDELAYEIVLKKTYPDSDTPVYVRQLYVSRSPNYVLLTFMTNSLVETQWASDIDFIIDSLYNEN